MRRSQPPRAPSAAFLSRPGGSPALLLVLAALLGTAPAATAAPAPSGQLAAASLGSDTDEPAAPQTATETREGGPQEAGPQDGGPQDVGDAPAPPEPAAQVSDAITVSAGPLRHTLAPTSAAATSLDVGSAGWNPPTLTAVAATAPGVSENGQGGLFQVVSIRGVSGQRVQTLISGAPIVGERRAGVSASFLDPRLLDTVEVARGPSSSFYGSGALGGVLQLVPRRFTAPLALTGYDSQGDERHAVLGWGDSARGWSAGLAHREAGNAEVPDGTDVHSRFAQTSAVVSKRWRPREADEGPTYELQVLTSWGKDIGKASADFPQESTLYPRERHLLATFSITGRGGWRLDSFVHPNDLQTATLAADGSSALVENRAVDFGFNLRRSLGGSGRRSARIGLDGFARRGVTADETQTAASGSVERFRTLDNASLDELGAFAAVDWQFSRLRLEIGGRASWQQQGNGAPAPAGVSTTSAEDTAGSGFIGLTLPLREGLELLANAGTGLRFANLSERFFVGTTGRGQVVGNPDLDPERSFNADLGLRWYRNTFFVAAYAYRNRIEDYIERIEVAPGVRSFRNLTRGTLEGFEIEALWHPSRSLGLRLAGHRVRGSSEAGEPLADVPADRVTLGIEGESGAWQWQSRWQLRWPKDEPAGGEKAIDGGHLVSAFVDRRLTPSLRFGLGVTNLLDEEVFLSADELATLAPGRSWGLRLAWRG